MSFLTNKKLVIVGAAGAIGSTMAQLAAVKGLTNNITLYDPTTGILSPLQVVIDNIYGTSREDALTATEYDALQLTATAYDAYAVSAFDYDMYGKTLLV